MDNPKGRGYTDPHWPKPIQPLHWWDEPPPEVIPPIKQSLANEPSLPPLRFRPHPDPGFKRGVLFGLAVMAGFAAIVIFVVAAFLQ